MGYSIDWKIRLFVKYIWIPHLDCRIVSSKWKNLNQVYCLLSTLKFSFFFFFESWIKVFEKHLLQLLLPQSLSFPIYLLNLLFYIYINFVFNLVAPDNNFNRCVIWSQQKKKVLLEWKTITNSEFTVKWAIFSGNFILMRIYTSPNDKK